MATPIASDASVSSEPRQGRPPLSRREPSVRVSVRVTVSTFDRLDAIARSRGCDLSIVLREVIDRSPLGFCPQK